MKLESVSIAGFRSIAELEELRISAPTLLTGHNDSGKSSILDAISFLLNDYSLSERDRTFSNVAVEGVHQQRVAETAVVGLFSLSDDEQQELELPATVRIRRSSVDGGSASYQMLLVVPADERFRGHGGMTIAQLVTLLELSEVARPPGQKDALIAAVDVIVAEMPTVEDWASVPAPVIKSLPRVERFEGGAAADAESAIRTALQTAYKSHIDDEEFKGDIRELELGIEEKLKVDATAIRDHIKTRCGDIGDVEIIPAVSFKSGLTSTQISVTGRKDEDVHLGEAGAGRARRVSLAVWEYTTGLLQGGSDVVLLYDEPDTHLDYSHQRDFMKVVRDQCALPNVGMVIATHSMNLIDGVDIADVVHVRHVDHRTIADRLQDQSDTGKHLGAVAASLGLRNTVLLHERLFVGVEGATETGAIPVLFRLATGRQLESCGIAIWACRNNEGAADFATFLVAHGRSVAFLVDADSRSIKHVFTPDKLRARGIDPDERAMYIGDPNELEDLFSDSQWCALANDVWPKNGGVWVEADFAALRSKKFSKDLESMLRNGSDVGPNGKPDVMIEMALSLKTAAEVPDQLCEVFKRWISLASS